MRLATILAVLALTGCDQPMAAPADDAPEEVAAVLQTEAEKACARMTNYVPEKLQAMSAQTRALVRREFNLCVADVTKGEAADETPGLRGHTDAPPT
jgi:hypothetical protein